MRTTLRLLTICTTLLVLILSSCAPTGSNFNQPFAGTTPQSTRPVAVPNPTATEGTPSASSEYYVPPYYSQFYQDTIDGSKQEKELIIYSTHSAQNWAPIIEVFNSHYPWIKVKTYKYTPGEVFERYYFEAEQNRQTADLVISSDLVSWDEFISNAQVLTYRSQEDIFIPTWSKTAVGVYTFSSDPLVIIYNSQTVAKPVTSIQQIAQLTQETPAYNERILTLDPATNSTGLLANWFWTGFTGEGGWQKLRAIGKSNPVIHTEDIDIITEVGTGRASIAYFVPGNLVLLNQAKYPFLGWSYIQDGQPLISSNMAITQKSANSNSAKLMIDFLLSQDGQLALEAGGLTPYREDIAVVSTYHINKIIENVGTGNVIFFTYDKNIVDEAQRDSFITRWQGSMIP